jgi:hypothetical protein
MIGNSVQVELENISERLIFPRDIHFSNQSLIYSPYRILAVKPDDVFFVSPALFIWIDQGRQQFNGITTSPKYLKLIDTLACRIPVVDFKNIDTKYSHLLMISNLDFNPNFKSISQVETEVNIVNSFIPKAIDFFTAELWSE